MDNFRDTLTNVTKSVYKTSKGFLKSTKLTLDLSNEESRLKALHVDIGKKVHEIYSYGGSLGKFFDEKYAELLECENKIDALRKELEDAKGTRICPKCGKTASAASGFCPKCGANLDSRAHTAEVRGHIQEIGYEVVDKEPAYREPVPAPQTTHFDFTVASDSNTAIQDTSTKSNLKKCQICGTDNAAVNKFCYSCGRIL